MSPSGINATYINSGTIDTNKLTIMSGLSNKVVLDQYGLSVKNNANKTSHVTRFSKDSAKSNANYVKQWGIDNNLASFIGVDPDNNAVVYTKGFLAAEEGSNIANWITSNEGFYHLNGQNQKDLWLSPTGISGTVLNTTQKYAYYSNGNFGVTPNGNLLANGANISGKIVVTDSTSTMNTGTVGGWTSNTDRLKNAGNTLVLSATGVGPYTVNGHQASNWAIYANGNFGVDTNGNLYANNVTLKGNITAESGKIAGYTITGDTLYGPQVGMDAEAGGHYAFWAGADVNNSENAPFRVGHDGSLRATSADISGKITATSGSIGGWTINSSSITRGSTTLGANGTITTQNLNATGGSVGGWTIDGSNGIKANRTHLNSNGNVEFYPNSGAGAEYIFNDGMTLHSTSAQTITSGANIMVEASTNLNLHSGDGAYTKVQGGMGIRLRAPAISIGTTDGNAKNTLGTIGSPHSVTYDPGVGLGTKTMKFVCGLLISDE